MRKKVNSFLVSIPDPQNSDSKIDIYLTPNKSQKIDVSFDNGSPSIKIKIKLKFSGKIYSMSKNSQYLDANVLKSISDSCNNYMKEQFTNYLYKTSKEFESDINGLGTYALSKFKTSNEFNNYNWLDKYKTSSFNIEISTNINSGFLLTQT